MSLPTPATPATPATPTTPRSPATGSPATSPAPAASPRVQRLPPIDKAGVIGDIGGGLAPNGLLRSDWDLTSVVQREQQAAVGIGVGIDGGAAPLVLPQLVEDGGAPDRREELDSREGRRVAFKKRMMLKRTIQHKRPKSKLEALRPSTREAALPPVYGKWLAEYWLWKNRARTYGVDHVDLSGWPMDKTVAGCVSTICKRARTLKLCRSSGVTDNILNRLAFLSKLQELDLTGCAEITDDGVEICRRHFPRLRVLSFSGCRQITRMSLCKLLKTTAKLTALDLSNCAEVTDAIFETLTFRAKRSPDDYPPLEDLNLSGCARLTAAGLGPFLQACTTLESLKLRGCKSIEGVGFAPMQERPQPILKTLDISGVVGLLDLDVAWIAAGAPRCRAMYLEGLTKLTDKGVELIVDVMSETLEVLTEGLRQSY